MFLCVSSLPSLFEVWEFLLGYGFLLLIFNMRLELFVEFCSGSSFCFVLFVLLFVCFVLFVCLFVFWIIQWVGMSSDESIHEMPILANDFINPNTPTPTPTPQQPESEFGSNFDAEVEGLMNLMLSGCSRDFLDLHRRMLLQKLATHKAANITEHIKMINLLLDIMVMYGYHKQQDQVRHSWNMILLTVSGSLFLPATFLTSIFSMNVVIPFAEVNSLTPWIVIITVTITFSIAFAVVLFIFSRHLINKS